MRLRLLTLSSVLLLAACETSTPSPTPTTCPTTLPQPAIATPATVTSPDEVPTLPAPAISLPADPHNQRAAYALLATHALYRTIDRGQTWRRLPLPATERAYASPLDPQNPNRIPLLPQLDIVITQIAPGHMFMRADQVLYRSDDQGATWQTIQDDVAAWTIDKSEGRAVYVWRAFGLSKDERGLYRSTDGGLNWQLMYAGFFPPSFQKEEFTPNHEGITALSLDLSNILYAGTDFGVFRSLSGGRDWQEFNFGLPNTQRAARWTPILDSGYPNLYALT